MNRIASARGYLVIALLLALPGAVRAEEKSVEPGPWTFGATASLSLAQSAFSSNWAGGDKGSVVWVLNSNVTGERQFSRRFNLSHQLQIAYGQTSRQTTDPSNPSSRVWSTPDKTTDQIAFESIGRFSLESYADPYLSFRLDSQFSDQSNPIGALSFNPIKLKESAGIARVLEKTEDREAITRLGFGFRQTLARSFVNPPTTETARFTSNDGGLEWQTSVTRPLLDKRVLYKGALLVFKPVFYSRAKALDRYDADAVVLDPGHEAVAGFWKTPDVSFQNTFSAKITKAISVDLLALWIYDKFDTAANVDNTLPLAVLKPEIDRNVRKAGQFKETLAIVLTHRLL